MISAADACRLLADELRRILGDGIRLDAATMHYIDSTCAAPTAEELGAVLADRDNCEREPLLALIFSPDEAMQIELEPLLERTTFSLKDQERVVDLLLEPPTVVRLSLPGSRGRLELQLTQGDARQFIGLLHLEKRLDPALRRAIDEHVDGSNAARVKVIFRNARCRFCSRDVRFLSQALAGLDAGRQSDVASLEHALGVLADNPSPADMFHVLMQRKKNYARQLQTSARRAEMLRRSNPEIMMLQGRPIGGINAAGARRLIAMIDRISLAVFSRTEPMSLPVVEAEYHICDRGDKVEFTM